MLLAVVVNILHGKTHYTPPVVFVEGKREGGVELQGFD
jgi:choline transport protein